MRAAIFLLLLNCLWLNPILADEDCVEGEEGCSSAHADGKSSKLKEAEVQNNILVLNDDNFGEIVQESDMILVTFYAPW